MKINVHQVYLIAVQQIWFESRELRPDMLHRLHDNLRYDSGFIIFDRNDEPAIFKHDGKSCFMAIFPQLVGTEGGTQPGYTPGRWGSMFEFIPVDVHRGIDDVTREFAEEAAHGHRDRWTTFKHPGSDFRRLVPVKLSLYAEAKNLADADEKIRETNQ